MIYVAKVSRHLEQDVSHHHLQESTNHFEKRILKASDAAAKGGYVLAKTCRIASIAAPQDVARFGLEGDTALDDVITSFALKSSLICLLKQVSKEEREGKDALFWARKIYTFIRDWLEGDKGEVPTWFDDDWSVLGCRCEVTRGCCKRTELAVSMCDNILSWLDINESLLQGKSFYDEKNLPHNCKLSTAARKFVQCDDK